VSLKVLTFGLLDSSFLVRFFSKKPRPPHLPDATAVAGKPGTGFPASKAVLKKDISNGEG